MSVVRIFPMSSNLWNFHIIQRHERGGDLLKPLTLYRWPAFKVWHQQIARCAKSRLIDIFLSISPKTCNFLSNTNQNYIGTYIHISKLWRVFGNCQYIFMRQKKDTMFENDQKCIIWIFSDFTPKLHFFKCLNFCVKTAPVNLVNWDFLSYFQTL